MASKSTSIRMAKVKKTIDKYAELRRKLESNPAEPEHILTVRKVGYRLKR